MESLTNIRGYNFILCRITCGIRHGSAADRLRVCGFESRQRYGCLSLVNCVLSGIRILDGPIPPPEEPWRVCVCVSVNVPGYNNNLLHKQWVGRRGQIKRERKKEKRITLIATIVTKGTRVWIFASRSWNAFWISVVFYFLPAKHSHLIVWYR
jgi:hypothetical protein